MWVGKYEVTNAQYRKFMRFRDGTGIDGLDLNADEQPAVFVSYCDALGFCHWLNYNTDIPEGYCARLPTGEEWTQLVRAGKDKVYPWGSSWPPQAGNYLDKAGNEAFGWEWFIEGYTDGFAVSAPVTLTPVNEWGIHGMGGNVREWTSESAKDGTWHIIRGGSWRDGDRDRLANEFGVAGAMWGKDNHIGIRVVLGRKPLEKDPC
ncbi:formylglycine-generating enzyme family protein [bacterium]|nr:formylglycine-generating enzyme family protein [bacterium]